MQAQRPVRNFLRILLVWIVIFTLVGPFPALPTPRVFALQTGQSSRQIMQDLVKDLSKRGYSVLGSGSWINGKFRDPLITDLKQASDFDMRLIASPGTSPDVAVERWKKAREDLTGLVKERFKGDPEAGKRILDKINMYPPDQLMEGVTSNEEALRRCSKYGAVPKLSHSGAISPDMDAEDLIGGVYGEGSAKARQFKEMTQGRLFANGAATNPDLRHLAEGTKDLTFTVKGQSNMAKQWGEFAEYWVKKGDPVMAEKYMSRLAADLHKARELAGADTSLVSKELQELAAALKAANKAGPAAGEAALAEMRSRLAETMRKAEYQASILNRLDGASANQANLLRTLLEGADRPDSKLSKYVGEAIEKLGSAAQFLDVMMKLYLSYDAIQSIQNGDYAKVLQDLLVNNVNLLPVELLDAVVRSLLEDAKTFGYDLVASRQSCDDLLAGIFVGGRVEAQGFSIGQLVDAHKAENSLQDWVRERSKQAADRGFEGTASDKITKGSGDAIYDKCYPYILKRWQGERQQILATHMSIWQDYSARGASLTAQPEPAYLDPTTGKVTVQVTAESMSETIDKAAGSTFSTQLKTLGKRLTGEQSYLAMSYQAWSPAPDGGGLANRATQSYTFTAPGDYEIRATIRMTLTNPATTSDALALKLDRHQVRDGTVTVHVLKAEDKPLCGGGPLIKSASRTTLEHEIIPAEPGQVAKPGVYITGSGDFSATDAKTGLRIGWQTRSGMRYCEGCTCLPAKSIGSFEIAASGRLKAVIESPQSVPALFTMGSSNTSMRVYWEPKIGRGYGKAEELLTAGSSGTDKPGLYHAELEADVPGPGRISAWIYSPRSSGSFTHACLDQAYTARVEVLSVGKKSPVNGETKLRIGDHIRTDGSGEAVIVMPWGGLRKLMPNSDLSIERVPSTSPDSECQEWTLKLNSGRLRVWSASIEEAETGGGIQAGPYTVKP